MVHTIIKKLIKHLSSSICWVESWSFGPCEILDLEYKIKSELVALATEVIGTQKPLGCLLMQICFNLYFNSYLTPNLLFY